MARLGNIVNVPLRTIWPDEARDFTPWLASEQGLNLLSDVLGLGLEVEQVEAHAGRFRVDIVARVTDVEDAFVIIENQYGSTDHDHLGKLLTYAASWNASTIVWVSENFTEEHRQTLDWLNENTPELNFFGLQIELLQIDQSRAAPVLRFISSPNQWVKAVRAERAREVSEVQLEQLRFWEELREYSRSLEHPPLQLTRKARPQHWYTVAIGRAGFQLAVKVNTFEDRVGCEIYMPDANAKRAFDLLIHHRHEIESDIGYEVEWQRLDEKKASRIVIYRDGDFQDPEQRQELIEWLYAMAVRFHNAFAARIRSLPL